MGDKDMEKYSAREECCYSSPQQIKSILPDIKDIENQGVGCKCTSKSQQIPNSFVKPGYKINPFVEEFITTLVGDIPRVKTKLEKIDFISTALVRSGIGRDNYSIAPGIYAIGNPGNDSHVLVTANYKLSFDHLRKALNKIDCWILVLDTFGVNVWCAAGEGSFSTRELVNRIKLTGIEKLITHKKIILPQLGAVGISALQVKKESGFKVIWGPVRSKDIAAFLRNEMKADKKMREVTFTIAERILLVPVEFNLVLKPVFLIFLVLFILSGIGPEIFLMSAAVERGAAIVIALISGMLAGAVFTPILLPWIYGTAFSMKGLVTGLAFGIPIIIFYCNYTGFKGMLALLMLSVSLSSFLAMNFTGATPFTSPSGVESEMRKAIPIQAVSAIIGLILWVHSGF
jgi:hypothetical protein